MATVLGCATPAAGGALITLPRWSKHPEDSLIDSGLESAL